MSYAIVWVERKREKNRHKMDGFKVSSEGRSESQTIKGSLMMTIKPRIGDCPNCGTWREHLVGPNDSYPEHWYCPKCKEWAMLTNKELAKFGKRG
jgi:rubredoxin